MSDCRFGVSSVNYPDPDPNFLPVSIRDFNGHLPYPFQNPISNSYLSLEAGKSSTDSVILRKLTNVEIILSAWTKSLKRTKLYFDD